MSTSRSAIETLMPAFFFDVVDSNGKLKFVLRGNAPVATIYSDQDVTVDNGTPKLEGGRTKETELPYQVTVIFPDKGREHETDSAYWRRLTGNSKMVMELQLPIDMSPDKATQIAQITCFSLWAGRDTANVYCPLTQLKLEPTDVVNFVKPNMASRTMRIIRKDLGADGEIKLEMVGEETSIYTSGATGTSGSYEDQLVTTLLATSLFLLDIPLLRDQDDGFGYYMAATGADSTWRGCIVYRSMDRGASYNQLEAVTVPVTFGAALTALPDFKGGNTFDELSKLRVQMMAGRTLSSGTRAQVLEGFNTMLIGQEVIGVRNAVLVSPNVYELSGFLRGRRGTEWAMGMHAIGDRVILASTQTFFRESLQAEDVGSQIWFKPVSFGMTLDETPVQSMNFTAAFLKPYAPTFPCVGRDSSGNAVIRCMRRTRVGGAWMDYIDVPLSEDSELYDFEIYTDSDYDTVVRTFSNQTTPEVSYTAAQQTTDFGSTQSVIYWKAYQISAQVGRGYALTAQG